MKTLSCLFALLEILVVACSEDAGGGGRVGKVGGVEGRGVPEGVLERVAEARRQKHAAGSYRAQYEVPADDRGCPAAGLKAPSYAKATCTTVPGRVVCKLGRYTFVINNGQHKMEPEVIERFAAMLYHRTQEGDSNFDVAVETPGGKEDEAGLGEGGASEPALVREPESPVLVECRPVRDERRLCQPPYGPSEVVYTCRRQGLGKGKRAAALITVRQDTGSVSDGRYVLPFKPLKRSVRENMEEEESPKDAKENVASVDEEGVGEGGEVAVEVLRDLTAQQHVGVGVSFPGLPPPVVRSFTDMCIETKKGSIPWCPNTPFYTDCKPQLCVTQCDTPNAKWGGPGSRRRRRGQEPINLEQDKARDSLKRLQRW